MTTLKLQTLPPAFGVRCASPFALKAETLLAIAGLDYEKELSQPRFGPRGKMPVLHVDGRVIPDTRNIQSYLEEERGVDFDGHLDGPVRAQVVALRRLAEEHLYWAQTCFRWADYPSLVRDTFFAEVPRPMRGFVFGMVKRKVDRDAWGHGFGRLPRPEQITRTLEDLEALRVALGDRPFFYGEKPGSLDASIYPLLLNLAAPGTPSVVLPQVLAMAPYIERVEQAVFGTTPVLAASPLAEAA